MNPPPEAGVRVAPGKGGSILGGVRAWLKAARPPSQSYLLLPLLLGQAMALHRTETWDWSIFVLVHAYGLAMQLFIVFANDWADRDTDRRNTTHTPFSGGSRVLVDGDLKPEQLARAAQGMALAAIGLSAALGLLAKTPLLPGLALGGIALLLLYSFPPVRLSYAGGGEFLQMLGVGMVLPLYGYVAQAGSVWGFPWAALWVILPTQLACAVGTALPDAPSDRMSRKRTVPVLIGSAASRSSVMALHAVSAFLLSVPVGAPAAPHVSWLMAVAAALALQGATFRNAPGSRGMVVFTFASVLSTLLLMAAMTALWLG